MDALIKVAHRSFDGVPEEVIWIWATVLAFVAPWLLGWDAVAQLAPGVVLAVWGGVVVLKMSTHAQANGVKLNDNLIFVMMCLSWLGVIGLFLRFGRATVSVRT